MRKDANNSNRTRPVSEYDERILQIRRVSKKNKGGNAISFAALAVVGDRKGKVGMGYGKAKDVTSAVSKAIAKAKETLKPVTMKEFTIPHLVTAKYGAAKVLLKPAPKGTGIIAGGAVRTVVELAGIKDISSKMLGSSNKISNIRCTLEALSKLKG